MARGVTELWLTITYFERWFNIQASVLVNQGVESRVNQDNGFTEYSLDDFFDKCSIMILERLLNKQDPSRKDQNNMTLKDRKTKAEITKLEIEAANKLIDLEIRKGKLCDVEEFTYEINRTMKQIADKLDTVPSRVKQENPTVPQSVLATVQSVMIEVRNNL